MRLALYQPDIPQNTGAILRLGACMATPVDIIEPCGFLMDDKRLKRAGLDYLDLAQVRRHVSWEAYCQAHQGRLVLLTTKTDCRYDRFAFQPSDSLILGRESAGVPQEVHDRVDQSVTIPMAPGRRSLNVALAAAMVLGEALRQTGTDPSAAVDHQSLKEPESGP